MRLDKGQERFINGDAQLLNVTSKLSKEMFDRRL